jgi:phage tail-like protein
MSGPFDAADPVAHPFTAFNFLVEIEVEGVAERLCHAAFSECDGLEASLEPQTIREGGRNSGPVHLSGRVSYAQLSLKRGMTANVDLWRWFERVNGPGGGGIRATADVVMLTGTRQEQLRFRLERCIPVKLKASALNATDGQLAIEEMQIAYEAMSVVFDGQPVTG